MDRNEGVCSPISRAQRMLIWALVLALTFGALSGCVRSKPPRTTSVATPVIAAQTNATPTLPAPPTALPTAILATPTLFISPTPFPTIEGGLPPMPATIGAIEGATAYPLPTETPTLEIATPEPTVQPGATITPTLYPRVDVTYTVKAGDTLSSIARQFQSSVVAIMTRNNLSNSNDIRVGQTLIIPAGSGPSTTPIVNTVRHTVKAGETLSSISRRYRTTVSDILAQNPSVSINQLSVGAVLTITVGTGPVVRTHTVRRGENLATIARRYGVSMAALVQANGLTNPNSVYVGQVLIIPAK